MLRLPVAVLMARVGRPDRYPDGEERQEGGDEIGARVGRLGEKAEAPSRKPGDELDPDQHQRGRDGHEGDAPLRAHGQRLTWVRGESGDRREVRGGVPALREALRCRVARRDRAEPRVQVPPLPALRRLQGRGRAGSRRADRLSRPAPARTYGNICSCQTRAPPTHSSAARSTRATPPWRSPPRRSSTSSASRTRSSSSCSSSKTPRRFRRAALRWHARYCDEVRDVGFEEAHAVLACLAGLDGRRPKVAAAALATLVHRRGLERASEALMRWANA